MATQKEVLESLVNQDELVYWAHKNNVNLEEFPGGFYADQEWKVNIQEERIVSVERRLDEPQQL